MQAKDQAEAKAPPGPEVPGKCNAIRRSGRRCRQTAGRGTPHPGRGPCKECTGSTRNQVTRYARQEAVEQARVWLDRDDLEIEPTDAALFNVRLAHTMVRFQRSKMAALEVVTPEDEAGLDRALRTASHVTDVALKANIAERLVNIAERAGEAIALICEDGLAALIAAGVVLSNAQRTAYANAVQASMARHEDEPLQLKAV